MKVNIKFLSSLKNTAESCSIAVLLPQRECETETSYLSKCRDFANAERLSLVTSVFEADGHRSAAFISPNGEVLQNMCFLDDKSKISANAGTDVNVIEMPFGNMALCCAEDIFQPQYARLAALKGCVLIVSCLWQQPEDYIFAGPWSAAQANCLPVCVAHKNGGKLILPCEMTENNSGFAKNEFNTDDISKAYQSFPVFGSLNAKFYNNYREALLK